MSTPQIKTLGGNILKSLLELAKTSFLSNDQVEEEQRFWQNSMLVLGRASEMILTKNYSGYIQSLMTVGYALINRLQRYNLQSDIKSLVEEEAAILDQYEGGLPRNYAPEFWILILNKQFGDMRHTDMATANEDYKEIVRAILVVRDALIDAHVGDNSVDMEALNLGFKNDGVAGSYVIY